MTDLSQKIASKQVERSQSATIEDYLKKYEPEFARSLGKSMDAAKFAQDALTAIKKTPQLQQADMRSLFGALFLAAQLKLPVGGPLQQFHLTPRKVQGSWTVVPVIGYQGYVQLAMNTGLYSKIGAFNVHERDHFTAGANSERGEFYDFEAAPGDRGELRGVIGYAKVKGFDETSFVYLDADRIRSRHRPANWEKTPWKSDEGEMFRKTAIRVLQKMLPKSIDAAPLALAAQADQARVSKVDGVDSLTVEHDDILDGEVIEDE